jgi:hypothetical protein
MQSYEHGASPSGYPLKPILQQKGPNGEGQCDHPGWNTYIPDGIGTVAPQYTQSPQHSFDMAYSIIDMTPLEQSNALMVSEYASNIRFDPEIDSFPDNPLALKDTGVLVPSGPTGFLIVIRSLLQTRKYQVQKIADDPLTIRGDLTIEGATPIRLQDGGAGSSKSEWQAELVKVSDIGER